jgi:hypothetical protein
LSLTLISVIGLSYLLSNQTPFGGDEFYTLDIDKIHKPIPYQLAVSSIIDSIDDIEPSDVFKLRLTSIFFTCIGIILLFYFFPKTKFELFILFVFLVSNPFLLSMSIFFRYYSYYLMASVIAFVLLVRGVDKFEIKTNLFISIIGSVGSIFYLYVLNAIQFGMYFLATFLFEYVKNKKARYSLFGIGAILISFILFNPKLIWQLFYSLNISGHAAVNLSSIQILGLTKATLIKPFYAIFQMIYGPDLAPTNSIFTIVSFLILSLLFLLLVYRIWQFERHLFYRMFFYVIVPFFIIYYFFQVLSLPGATQLEPKHGMLLFPLIIYLATKSHQFFSPVVNTIFIGLLISAQLTGMVKSFEKQHTNWNYIASQSEIVLSKKDNSALLMDGRSKEIFSFYSNDLEKEYPIHFTWEPIDSIKKKLKNKTKIILLLNDYKSYTSLSLEQNWNAGAGSEGRVLGLQHLLEYLNFYFEIQESYVLYPTFYYELKRKKFPSDIKSFGVWKHHLKDLRLPILTQANEQLQSSILIHPKESVHLDLDSLIVFNLENSTNELFIGDTVGLIQSKYQKYPLVYGENIWDVFSEYHHESIKDSGVFHEWEHTPLVSGAIQYSGSFFKHKARLYKLVDSNISGSHSVINLTDDSDLRVWKGRVTSN